MSYYQDDGSVANKAIAIAAQQAGKPYIWGAAGPDTFDCSGLVHYAYAGAGLPGAGRQTSHLWSTASIRFMGDPVSFGSEQPGDLVMPHSGHVGICIGNGKMWNAPQTGIPVRIDSYSKPFAIRRVSSPGTGAVDASTTGFETTANGPIEWWGAFVNMIHGFDSALEWLADGHNWIRIGEVVGGTLLIYQGIRMG
jgi:hypothetical protein